MKKAAATPQMWNRYSYVLNNPLNMTDPTGRCGEAATFIGPKTVCPPAPAPSNESSKQTSRAADVFVFASLTGTTDTPVKAAAEGVALVGYNSDSGFYAGVIGAGGVEVGSHVNYVGVFHGAETPTESPKPTQITLKEVGLGIEAPFVAGAGGGAGKYDTKHDTGAFVFGSGGVLGQHGAVGVGTSVGTGTFIEDVIQYQILMLENIAYGGH